MNSVPGQGSTFAFTARFGLRPHPPETTPASPPVVLRDLPVLIVDDNATNRHILEEWLRGYAMEPTVAGNAATAMDVLLRGVAQGRPYPLVLLDGRMPDIDGLALAAKIRQQAELSATRIILLTSGDRPGDLARARQLGISAILLKPLQQRELMETILRVMGHEGDPEGLLASPAVVRPPVPEGLVGVPLRILAAEDNVFNRDLLEHMLTRLGLSAAMAVNGREALALLEREPFDLLLLDIHMPELDGFQVVGAIRERERTAGGHLPVIALTARSRKEDRERCLRAGMDECLTKPYTAADLWATMDRVLRKDEGGNRKDENDKTSPADSSSATGLIDPHGPVGRLRGRPRHAAENVPEAPVPRPGGPGGGPRCLTRSGRPALTRSGSQVVRHAFGVLHGRRRPGGRPGRPCGPRTAPRSPPRRGATGPVCDRTGPAGRRAHDRNASEAGGACRRPQPGSRHLRHQAGNTRPVCFCSSWSRAPDRRTIHYGCPVLTRAVHLGDGECATIQVRRAYPNDDS